MIPPSLMQRLFLACLLFLLAALALEWAASILQRIWPTLATAAGVGAVAWVIFVVVRRRNRW